MGIFSLNSTRRQHHTFLICILKKLFQFPSLKNTFSPFKRCKLNSTSKWSWTPFLTIKPTSEMFFYQQSTQYFLPLRWDGLKCNWLTTGLIHTHSTCEHVPCRAQYHLLSELPIYWQYILPENKLRMHHLADNGSPKETLLYWECKFPRVMELPLGEQCSWI